MKSSYELILPLMERAGINKSKLAQIAGVGPSAVTNWANGDTIKISNLAKIAEYFKVDIRELMPCSISPEVKQTEISPEIEVWKKRALDAEAELRRYKTAFAKIVKSNKLIAEVLDDLQEEGE